MEGEGKGARGKREREGRGGNVEFHHLLLSNLTTDIVSVTYGSCVRRTCLYTRSDRYRPKIPGYNRLSQRTGTGLHGMLQYDHKNTRTIS